MSDLLSGFPIVVQLPVAWAEMDVLGHVNNTVFFRYFESARIEYLARISLGEPGETSGGIGPILASTQARFRRPLVYPDTVRVGARTRELGADRFVMEYRVISERGNCIAADGGGVVVAYDYRKHQKAPVPDFVRQAIAVLEGWEPGSEVVQTPDSA